MKADIPTNEEVRQAISLILSGDPEEGREQLSQYFMDSCIQFMKTKESLPKTEGMSVFYDALLVVCERVQSNDFIFKDASGFKNYLLTTCLNKARQYKRQLGHGGMMFREQDWGSVEGDVTKTYERERANSYQQKGAKYGIPLMGEGGLPGEGLLPKDMMKAFHVLGEKCRLLIMLHLVFKISHREIVQKVSMFFPIKNEDVSRTTLTRCRKKWKKQIGVA